MNRRTTLLMLMSLPLASFAQSTLDSLTSAMKSPLTQMLTSQLGVTEKQATGGLGSYLTLAKEKLAKGDFEKVASLVPGASKYMDDAKSYGAITGPVGGMSGLNAALGKLGISPEIAAQFVPTITNYLGKAGGPTVQKLLATVASS